MAKQLDYARNNNGGNSNKKKQSPSTVNKLLLVFITLFIVTGFAATLYLLKEKAPPAHPKTAEKTQSKSQLPSRPEEVWSYIKELESRTVVTDETKKAGTVELTEKQKEELLRLEEREKQAALDKAMEKLMQEDGDGEPVQTVQYVPKKDYAALKAEEARAAEQKKQAELKKAAEQKKAEELRKAEEAKKAETAKKEEPKKETQIKPSTGKFGLQCGAFKNKAQADALQARLVKAGLSARVNAGTDWNRVVVGPMNERADAVKAQQQAASVINCVILAM